MPAIGARIIRRVMCLSSMATEPCWRRTSHRFVVLAASWDLLLCAKHLFVAARKSFASFTASAPSHELERPSAIPPCR